MAFQVITTESSKFKFFPIRNNEFNFKIRARRCCYIGLLESRSYSCQIYEIILGDYANTKSIIRDFHKHNIDLASVATPDILSDTEFRGFWIRWDKNVIAVGREGNTDPFISYDTKDVFNIKYIGLSSSVGITGTWILGDDFASALSKDGFSAPASNGKKDFTEFNTPGQLSYKFFPANDNKFIFRVCAPRDVRVLLSASPTEHHQVYEIIIGGSKNTISEIREDTNRIKVSKASTPEILSSSDFRGFWIMWNYDVITVGREGEIDAFMSYIADAMFPIKCVGIYTAKGATGTWMLPANSIESGLLPNSNDDDNKDDIRLKGIWMPITYDPNAQNAVKSDAEKGDLIQEPKLARNKYIFFPVRNGKFSCKLRALDDIGLALSSSAFISDQTYEIDCCKNWQTADNKYNDVAEDKNASIYTTGEVPCYWIRWHNNVITVGHECKRDAFMTYKNDVILSVQYIGICTTWGERGTIILKDELKAWPSNGKGVAASGQVAPKVMTGDDEGLYTKINRNRVDLTSECHTPSISEYKFFRVRNNKFTCKLHSLHGISLALSSSPSTSGQMYELDCRKTSKVITNNDGNIAEDKNRSIFTTGKVPCYWIRWDNHVITVGREGESNAFMSYKNHAKFSVKYIGIYTTWGETGTIFLEDDLASSDDGVSGTWELVSDGKVPPQAIVTRVKGKYIARTLHRGELIPGTLEPSDGKCYIAHNGRAYGYKEYEVLCNKDGEWVKVKNGVIPQNAYRGGNTAIGSPLFIGRVRHKGIKCIGKVKPWDGCCYIPYDGFEYSYKEFDIYVSP